MAHQRRVTLTPDLSDIIAAMDAPELFGPHFTKKSWRAWRAMLSALFALPMTADQLEIYQTHTGRSTPPAKAFTEAALIVGRRGGKSRVLALIAVFLACFRDYAPYLAPGEVATIAVLAANRSQARSIFRFVSGMLKAVPLLASLVIKEDAETILLSNRVIIEISTASFRTTRGYSFAAVLADEIAFWPQDEASANPDVEILRALRPGMASIPGSILLLASSPYAKKGALYQTYRTHYAKDNARVLVWKATTASMNPMIDPAIIEEAYEADPEAARAEYGAEFRDDLADFVTREIVDAATAWGRTELPPEPGVTYTAFCDPSGGASDAMTLAIAHITHSGVLVLDAAGEARPPFDPEAVVVEFAALLQKFGVDRVVGDRYGGEWPRQRFREHGIHYEPSAQPKSDLYLNLLPLLNAGRVELLDNPRLSAQLVGLERRTARSGKDSVDHIPGGHDDLVNAVAGALVGLDLDRRPALIHQNQMLVNSEPAPFPEVVDGIYAVMMADKNGQVAITYFARTINNNCPLLLLDFDAGPMSGTTICDAIAQLKAFEIQIRVRKSITIFASESLVRCTLELGFTAHVIPEYLLNDAPATSLNSASHVARGHVKICQIAHDKAKTHPLGGALNIRAGEDASNPLRAAMLLGISIGLVRT